MKKIMPQQKGFVILFTILISVIILMIGLGIFSIATRETVLSGTAREAQYAFYAADAGVECALYAETQGVFSQGSGGLFPCGATGMISTSGPNTFTFNVLIDAVDKTCARVTVINSTGSRRVISQGYNICNADGTPAVKNPLLVERDLDTVYQLSSGSGNSAGGGGGSGLDATLLPETFQNGADVFGNLLLVP